jgi:hypothetical protein
MVPLDKIGPFACQRAGCLQQSTTRPSRRQAQIPPSEMKGDDEMSALYDHIKEPGAAM